MATRTTYTSTVTVPVYASWKCEKCGEINFSTGGIRCQQQESTTSFRNSKHEEAKAKASKRAHAAWVNHAYHIMTNPQNHATEMRSDFFLQNTNCTKCGTKPKWDKDTKYLTWTIIGFMGSIISGLVAFASVTDIGAWLVFLGFLSMIIYGFATEAKYKKTMANLPKELTPVIGSLNTELIEHAKSFGVSVPTPEESIAIVKTYTETNYQPTKVTPSKTGEISIDISAIREDKATPNYCRKCGAQLQTGSEFCHKCGTKIDI